MRSWRSIPAPNAWDSSGSSAGAFLSRGAFAALKKRIDYSEYGGAPLLGVKGVCIICHGSSNVNAIKNAIRFAAEYASEGVNTRIESDLARNRTDPPALQLVE